MNNGNGYISKTTGRWFIGVIVTILLATFGFMSGWITNVDSKVNKTKQDVSSLNSHFESINQQTQRIEEKLDQLIYDLK